MVRCHGQVTQSNIRPEYTSGISSSTERGIHIACGNSVDALNEFTDNSVSNATNKHSSNVEEVSHISSCDVQQLISSVFSLMSSYLERALAVKQYFGSEFCFKTDCVILYNISWLFP